MDREMLRETRDQLTQFEERLLRLEAGRRQRQQQQTVSAGFKKPFRTTLTLFNVHVQVLAVFVSACFALEVFLWLNK